MLGVGYGVLARFVAATEQFGDWFAVMSIAFLVVVPLVIGVLTVSAVDAPSIAYRIFAPWVPMLLVVLTVVLIGWEGGICVYMGLPILLLFASLGGIIGARVPFRRRGVRAAVLVLPFALGPVERGIPAPDRLTETVTTIDIAAPPAVVWPLITSVDSIRPEEQHPALFTRMGFPRPISATLSRPGVGGIRTARFERGLAFAETVTEWVPEQRLRFAITPFTDSVPPTTLDEHVTIGGPYFDVLTGSYELTPIDQGRGTHLVLRSEHRVSTRFNLYAGWWVDRIMASIQDNILEVHKARAERGAPAFGHR